MARATKATASARRTVKTAKPRGRPAAAKAAPAPAPKVSKDELRARVEKLERTVATLRAKNRELGIAAKHAGARVAELEDEIAALQKTATSSRAAKPRRPRRPREHDPGDAVPPGVAVEEPAPLDTEAETALENLEEHLSGE